MRLSRRHLLLGTSGLTLLGCSKKSLREFEAGREVAQVLDAQPTRDGAGVSLKRALGGRSLSLLDPFLLLDEFQSDNPNDYLAGFPDHPHRGFETVTYMIQGAMEHRDTLGNQGRLGPGGAQWMTAGHGIIHSEMPKQERGLMWGFQLWVNLPAARKMIPPRYQDIPPDQVAEATLDGAKVRVVAGTAFGKTGPVSGIDVEPLYFDATLERGAELRERTPLGHNAFAYVTDGAVRLGPSGREVRKGQLAVLGPGDGVVLRGTEGGGRALLIAGRPLREPVARGGPFVMNTQEELRRAYEDYRSGRLTQL
jgi:redox-sensitive bicupin YhaK (pirin superfamily)